MLKLLPLTVLSLPCLAQTVCQPVPAYSPCEIVFELTAQEAAANPYLKVQLEAEFRSPRYRTFRMPAFWDGGRRMVIRFTPTDPGDWAFRVSSNLARFQDKEGSFSATVSQSPGFIRATNVHHWAWVDDNNKKPHLWMGDTLLTLPFVERAAFEKILAARAAQKFTHLRGCILAPPGKPAGTWLDADHPNPEMLRELDERVRALNAKGIVADLILAYDPQQLATIFPAWAQRERFLKYVIARYAALDVTWQGFVEFERQPEARALLREVGTLLKKGDPYQHPRSTGTSSTSSGFAGDEWMNYITTAAEASDTGAIEHQLYAAPLVDLGWAQEDSGAGKRRPGDVDTDAFRRRLWHSTMSGQYPTFANTGTRGGDGPVDAAHADSPGARQMAVWFDFMSRTRFWDMEPYFDVDGGRAIALEGTEYIVYVDKPGTVELVVEKHGYQVTWFNPVTGESFREKKDFKGDRFSGEPPDKSHDWVLDLCREGHRDGMKNSYKFESHPIVLQEIEQAIQKIPFEIAAPASDRLELGKPAKFAIKLTRDTRATRSMMYLWMGEVAADQEGARMIGAGAAGTFSIPPAIAHNFPAVLAVRLYGMNALGKVYSIFKVYQLSQ